MGFELDRLMKQYGVSTPTIASYSGALPPGAYADVVGTGEGKLTPEQFNALQQRYVTDQAAYDQYVQDYKRRVAGTPMYLQEQFQPGVSTAPPAVTFSGAQRAAMGPGGIGQDEMNRNIRDWFAANPNATPAEIRAAQKEWGVSDMDVRNAMGIQRPRSAAYRAATGPGGIGLEGMEANIRKYFADNPYVGDQALAAEQARWGLGGEDLYRAMGSFWGNQLRSPSYLNVSPTLSGMTEAQKVSYYRSLIDKGYGDEAVRAEVTRTLGPQSDADWAYLRAKAFPPTPAPAPSPLGGGTAPSPGPAGAPPPAGSTEEDPIEFNRKVETIRKLYAQTGDMGTVRREFAKVYYDPLDTTWMKYHKAAFPEAAKMSTGVAGWVGKELAPEAKAALYNQYVQGFVANKYTPEEADKIVRRIAERDLGVQSDADWNALKGLAAKQPVDLLKPGVSTYKRDVVKALMPTDPIEKINWLNANNVTLQELEFAQGKALTPEELSWMGQRGYKYAPAAAPAPAPAPAPAVAPAALAQPVSAPAAVPTPASALAGPTLTQLAETYAAAPAPAPMAALTPAPMAAPAPAPLATPAPAPAVGRNLMSMKPLNWELLDPQKKIQWFNQQKATPQEILAAGGQQSDIDWMRTQGYGFAEGGAVEVKNFQLGGLNTDNDRDKDFASLAEEYGAGPPSGLGAAPMAAPAAMGTPAAAPQPMSLESMLAKYMQPATGGVNYGQELAAARKTAQQETEAFQRLLQQAIAKPEQAPSKAELYFRLAAAFAEPGKTGSFGEGLGRAASAVAEQKKAEREAQKADAARRMQLGLTAQQARMQAAKEDVGTLRTLASEEEKSKRAVASELLKEWVKKNDPVSTAGKQAQDEGLRPGTPEFQRRVKEISDLSVERQMTQINAMVAQMGAAAANLAIAGRREARAEAATKKLTPAEVKLKTETEDLVQSADSALGMLQRAYELSPKAFDASLPDVAQRKVLEAAGSKDKKLVATREMENLLGEQALAKLKATFGGAPTEGERAILMDLSGIGAKSREEREQILKNAFRVLRDRRAAHRRRLEDIKAGLYSEKTETE